MEDATQAMLESQLRATHSRILVLHPRYTPQRQLVSPFFREPDAVYIRFNFASESVLELETIYRHALTEQWPNRSLSDLKLLVLDECDRVDGVLWVDFLRKVLAETSARIVMFTRRLLHQVLTDPVLTQHVSLVPCSNELMLTEFRHTHATPLLEVRALCAGRAYVNGHAIEQWDGALPRALFFFLVDRGMVTRNQIFETFWPKLNLREATNVFHVTKRKINEVLGFDLMDYSAGFYRVSGQIDLRYDVNLFLQWIQDSAVASSETAPELLYRALSLYRSGFLQILGNEFDWVRGRREQLRLAYGDALGTLGHWRIQQGEPDLALHLFGRASAINPHREDLADQMMRLYYERGKSEHGLMVYRRLQGELQQRLQIQPARALQELARTMGASD